MECIKCKKNIPEKSLFCPYCGVGMEIKCKNCGAKLEKDFKFCNVCGKEVISSKEKEGILICSVCGTELKSGSVFCKKCGKKISN